MVESMYVQRKDGTMSASRIMSATHPGVASIVAVNERQLDGSMGSFAAAPFSAEVEEANGRVCRDHAAPVDLDAIRPATREERAQYQRERAAGADLPF